MELLLLHDRAVYLMPSDSDHKFIKEMKKLNEYYGRDCDLSVLDKAMLLDPRFKNVSFLSSDCLLQEMAAVAVSPLASEASTSNVQPPPKRKKDSNRGKLIELLGDIVHMPEVRAAEDPEERAKIELQRYMADVVEQAADDIDPLLWWKQNSCRYHL